MNERNPGRPRPRQFWGRPSVTIIVTLVKCQSPEEQSERPSKLRRTLIWHVHCRNSSIFALAAGPRGSVTKVPLCLLTYNGQSLRAKVRVRIHDESSINSTPDRALEQASYAETTQQLRETTTNNKNDLPASTHNEMTTNVITALDSLISAVPLIGTCSNDD